MDMKKTMTEMHRCSAIIEPCHVLQQRFEYFFELLIVAVN